MVIFKFYHSFYMSKLTLFCKEVFLIPPLSLTVDSLISFCCNSLLSLLIVILKLSQIQPVGVPSSQPHCPLDVSPLLDHFPAFWTRRCSRLTLYLPHAWNQSFLQESSSLHSGVQQPAVHRVSKPRGSTNGVYVVPALRCDMKHFPGCTASQTLFSGPTEDFMSHLTPVNHSLCI